MSADTVSNTNSALPAEPESPLLQVEALTVHFPIRSPVLRRRVGSVHAVDGVDFELARGETLGLVGESGCGKTTTAQAAIRLIDPTGGKVVFDGRDITTAGRRQLRRLRAEAQIVLQDPFASLNPRLTARSIIAEPLRVHRSDMDARTRRRRVDELLERVGLSPAMGARFPHEFSGGQRQRIGIARALALEPRFVVLDEPVSALDVSIQAQIVNLLDELQTELGLSYLLVAHDLAVVKHICDRVAVMYLGRIVETGTCRDVYHSPRHPYTRALLSAVPVPEPDGRHRRQRIVLQGDVPSPANPPSGCRFRTRCWKATERCASETPVLQGDDASHAVACFFPESTG